MTEVRHTSESGGEKGRKPEMYSLIPVGPLAELARVYGYGSLKYQPRNWERGYPFSWSLDSLYRHIEAFRGGQNLDPESGLSHLAHAGFHIMALQEFVNKGKGTDDRST